MSDDATSKDRPTWLSRIVAIPKSWSIPVWASIALGVFLLLFTVACWGWFQYQHQYVPWYHYMTWERLLLTVVLLAVVPYVFFVGLRLWLQGEASRFPELEKAWNAGIHALSEAGITLDSAPLFLCIGSNEELQERAIMNAHPSPLSVVGVPKGPAPLHWYGNSEAIYLFCSDASWLSALNRLRLQREEEAAENGVGDEPKLVVPASTGATREVAPAARPPATGSVVDRAANAGGLGERAAAAGTALMQRAASGAASDYRGTMQLDHFVSESAPVRAATSAATSMRGTMIFDALDEDYTSSAADQEVAPAPEVALQQKQPVVVPPRDATIRLNRLQTTCQHVRNGRRPLCPINGILALLPFEMIHATADETEELERAVKNDLNVVRDELGLRAPVTTLVVGLEKESGFRELVRRVGREKSATQRFGGRYDIRAVAAADHLRSFSAHVCGAFEDWAYTLFRAKGALSRPGNSRLYSLLCKVRCVLKHKLGRLLANGIGFDARQAGQDGPHLFSGCYFAATGRTGDRQAFSRGVLEKLIAEQEQIEWTERAVTTDRRCRQIFYVGLVVDVALLGLLVYISR